MKVDEAEAEVAEVSEGQPRQRRSRGRGCGGFGGAVKRQRRLTEQRRRPQRLRGGSQDNEFDGAEAKAAEVTGVTANTTKVDEAEAEAAEVARGAASDTRANKVDGAEAMAAENAEGQPRQRKSTKQRQRLRRFRRGSKDNEGRRSRGRGCGGFGRAAKTTKVDGAEAEASSDFESEFYKRARARCSRCWQERGRVAAGNHKEARASGGMRASMGALGATQVSLVGLQLQRERLSLIHI